ncbi:hypothetical protein K443DRAFT_13221 [Laccaria amethystina LaAM-08-1]|uniref:Uncharacterized protein n=1 Tax=Laccaria amethystina LaAM-08-1 TaxID=1095629 RepID=A0A0C9WPQ9_9AGAR|nr:hypothetical protein K443DRAFT_13221 [Laccaria amethystina LaAM-08-1]
MVEQAESWRRVHRMGSKEFICGGLESNTRIISHRQCTRTSGETTMMSSSEQVQRQADSALRGGLMDAYYVPNNNGGKVRFSSVQRAISLNLELNSRFGSGYSAKP